MNLLQLSQVRPIGFLINVRNFDLSDRHRFFHQNLIFIACFSLFIRMAAAQEDLKLPGPDTNPPISIQPEIEPETIENPHSVSKVNFEKRKKATAGLAAVGGIAILGIGAIAVTMLWARRLRRIARDLGPQQTTTGNDFWFLKPPKQIVSDAGIAPSHRPPDAPPRSESAEPNR